MTLPMDILHTDPGNAAKAIKVMYMLLLLAGLLVFINNIRCSTSAYCLDACSCL